MRDYKADLNLRAFHCTLVAEVRVCTISGSAQHSTAEHSTRQSSVHDHDMYGSNVEVVH